MLMSELCSLVPVYSATLFNELLEGINNLWTDDTLLHSNRLANFLVSKAGVFYPLRCVGLCIHHTSSTLIDLILHWVRKKIEEYEEKISLKNIRCWTSENVSIMRFTARSSTNWILHLQDSLAGLQSQGDIELISQESSLLYWCPVGIQRPIQ